MYNIKTHRDKIVYKVKMSKLAAPIKFVRYVIYRKLEAQRIINLSNREYSTKLLLDMMWKCALHSLTFTEYIAYKGEKLSCREMGEYIGDKELVYYRNAVNSKDKASIFNDKNKTFFSFRDYYKRDACVVLSGSDEEKHNFKTFAEKNKKFIVKPICQYGGHGIKAVAVEEREIEDAFLNLCKDFPEGYIAEELVRQREEMAAFHPQSVNTLRIITIKQKDNIRIWHPFIRTGVGNSCIDNVASGGLMASVDPTTGVCFTDAVDLFGNFYLRHPDSKIIFKGFLVPEWNDAMNLAKNLSKVVPEVKIVGWDLAYTDDGWVMIEGNSKPSMLMQICEQKGLRKEFLSAIKEV